MELVPLRTPPARKSGKVSVLRRSARPVWARKKPTTWDDWGPRLSTTSPTRGVVTPLRLLVAGLLLVIIPTVYYMHVFRWRRLDNHPGYDMLVVQENDLAKLASFRLQTVSDLIEPALEQTSLVRELRKSTNQGTIRPVGYERRLAAINEKLEILMEDAKSRRVPEKYRIDYSRVVLGIAAAQRACAALDEATWWYWGKTELIYSSIAESKSAETRLKWGRAVFEGQPNSSGSDRTKWR